MILFLSEMRKIWKKRTFLFSLSILMIANLFLLWYATRSGTDAIPPSAYRQLTIDIRDLTMQQKKDYIESHLQEINMMMHVETILKAEVSDPENGKTLRAENFTLLSEYEQKYSKGNYLKYTSSLQQEAAFWNEIYNEFSEVDNYPSFLYKIQQKSDLLQSISIFSVGNSYDKKNITLTSQAFEKMHSVEIDYHPQKGIVFATEFKLTDIIIVFSLLFLASALIREETDNGMLRMIRSTTLGRSATAFAKIIALAISVLFIVILLYGINFIYCLFVFGFGDMTRNIQSIPRFMRSVFQLQLWQYIFTFIFIKWISIFISGIGIMLCAIPTKRMLTGSLLATLMFFVNFLLYTLVPPAGEYNVLRYANLYGLMQTNEILGIYRNLHWFGSPISLISIDIFFGFSIFSIFFTLFILSFNFNSVFLNKKRISTTNASLAHSIKIKCSTVFAFECLKTYCFQGVLLLLLGFLSLQIINSQNNTAYLSADELYYKYYMTRLAGPITQEKHSWLKQEYEKFKPIITLETKLSYNQITSEEFSQYMSPYQSLVREYAVFQKVLAQYHRVYNNPNLHFVYDTGYLILFNEPIQTSLESVILCGFFLVVCNFNVFTKENSTNMIKIIAVTSLGQKHTTNQKLKVSLMNSLIITVFSLVPSYWKIIRGYGFSSLFSPVASIEGFSHIPVIISIIGLLLFSIIVRFLACCFLSTIILRISQKNSSAVTSICMSLFVSIFPCLLVLSGILRMRWLTLQPLFNSVQLIATTQGTIQFLGLILLISSVIFYNIYCLHNISFQNHH